MLTIWRISMRTLSFDPLSRNTHSKHFAIKSRSEREAVDFAKTHIFTPAWWDGFIITEITPIGELWAVDGFVVPMEGY